MYSYQDIAKEYSANPRDIKTDGKQKWFRPTIKKGIIYAESGQVFGAQNSQINCDWPLHERDYAFMLKMYLGPQDGDEFSSSDKERLKNNHSKSYWYGIFADLGFQKGDAP